MNWVDPWGLNASEKKNELTRDQTLDTIQMTLNMAGLIPGVGEIADVANGFISLARGNYEDAALSFVSMVPVIGDAIGKGGKAAKKIARAVKRADNVVDTVKTTQNISKIVRSGTRRPADSNHGNSLTTTKPAQGYALKDRNTGKVLKYGETTQGNKRYTKKYLNDKNADMDFQAKGSKKEMHDWQHEKILDYKDNHNGERPPLNKSDW